MALPNVITVSVDTLNDGSTIVDEVYEDYDRNLPNRVVYITEASELSAREELAFYRTLPKKNGNFKGVGKTVIKFTKDVLIPGIDGKDITQPMIFEISASVPVGTPQADILKHRQRCVALLDNDAICDDVQRRLMI